jgi:hypothetical protein
MTTIFVPTIRDEPEHFTRLFELAAAATTAAGSVSFDFKKCRYLMQNGVAVLGGLARLLQSRAQSVQFKWWTMRSKIAASLGNNGFLRFFGRPGAEPTGTAAEFRQDTSLDKEALVGYLVQDWIGTGRIDLSAALKEAVVSTAC